MYILEEKTVQEIIDKNTEITQRDIESKIDDKLNDMHNEIDNKMNDIAIKIEHLGQLQNIHSKILKAYLKLCISLLIWVINTIVLVALRLDVLLIVALSLCLLLFILLLFIPIIMNNMKLIEKLTIDGKIRILKEVK